MKKQQIKSIKKFIPHISASLLSILAVACVIFRVMSSPLDYNEAMVFAAKLSLPTGNTSMSDNKEASKAESQETSETSEDKKQEASEKPKKKAEAVPVNAELSEPTEEELAEYDKAHEGENKYTVYETNITGAGEKYDNFYVKNNASADIDIGEELSGELGFTIEKSDQPQVLIVHTHTGESYLKYDTGYYYESYYPRTDDNNENVCAVGAAITKSLNKRGIKTIHDTTKHDESYNGAYDNSMETIQSYLEKYPSIKVVLDIH